MESFFIWAPSIYFITFLPLKENENEMNIYWEKTITNKFNCNFFRFRRNGNFY